ncbi:hypothetical protein [Polaribacter sp.]|uniref:O-antigen ligase family protein n=1 Tax=Polaribacter sp. TaxID=1920175 RepID=UPI0025D7DD9A|nr:hypothetical protein [Polaribacter sp.]
MAGYFIILLISALYSSNKEEAIKVIIQLTPLLIIPFLLSFTNFSVSKKKVSTIFILFICVNISFTILISYFFITNPDRFEFDLKHYLLDYDKFQFIINNNLYTPYFLVHKPYFSMGFVLCAIFSLHTFFQKKSATFFNQSIYLLLFFYFSLWIFYAFSFPNVIALLLSIVLILYLNLKKNVFLTTLFIFFVTIAIFLNIKSKDIDVKRGFNFIKSIASNEKFEVNDTRFEIYKTFGNIVSKSNFSELIFGFGVGDVQDKLNSEYLNRLSLNKSRNLLYFSEEFNHKYWFRNNIHVNANTESSPASKKNADLIILDKISQEVSHNICANVKVKKEELYTFSIHAKKGNFNKLILRLGNINQRVVFNVETGEVFQKLNVENAEIIELKNGWYRCYISVILKKDALALIGIPNEKGSYVYTSKTDKNLYFWGIQLEKGRISEYVKNKNEQLQIAIDKKLNTHNNYLYFLMSTGIIGLLSFLVFIYYLFKKSLKSKDVLMFSFCITIVLNFLTENILSRHWGLMFITFMLILLFSNRKKTIES